MCLPNRKGFIHPYQELATIAIHVITSAVLNVAVLGQKHSDGHVGCQPWQPSTDNQWQGNSAGYTRRGLESGPYQRGREVKWHKVVFQVCTLLMLSLCDVTDWRHRTEEEPNAHRGYPQICRLFEGEAERVDVMQTQWSWRGMIGRKAFWIVVWGQLQQILLCSNMYLFHETNVCQLHWFMYSFRSFSPLAISSNYNSQSCKFVTSVGLCISTMHYNIIPIKLYL